jgi:Coenzyme PQQ synthesis protein D (PqqD)
VNGPLEPTAVVRRSPSALAERVGSETVLLDMEGDVYLRLNSSGGRLWDALEEPTPAGELARVLERVYGLEPERAMADVGAFVSNLSGRGLLDVESG